MKIVLITQIKENITCFRHEDHNSKKNTKNVNYFLQYQDHLIYLSFLPQNPVVPHCLLQVVC